MLARRICSSVVLPLFLAVSCVEKIVLDPMEEMPVVVNCVLMTERTTQELDLYYAKRPSETAYVPITDAKVVVRDASGNSHAFQWNGERWTSDFVPAYKTRYVLEIETRDGKKLSAETTVPDDYLLVPNPYFSETPYFFRHPQIYIQYNTYYFARTTGASTFEPYSGELYAWITCGARLSTDHIDVDIFNLIPGKSWDLILHPYFDQVKVYYDTYIEKLPLYQGFLRIHQRDSFTGSVPEEYFIEDNRADPNNLFILSSDPELTELNEDGTPVMFKYRVRFVSPEYDRFLKDLITDKWIHEDELAQLYSMEPVYSNIAGGLGIFGAEVTRSTSYFGYLHHYIE